MIQLEARKKLVDRDDPDFSVTQQCIMLSINHSTFYYKGRGVSQQDLAIMLMMDKMHSDDPTRGTRRWRRELKRLGIILGRDKIATLMRIMRIEAVYRKPRTTISDPTKYKYPYLLRKLKITRPNQVWQIDISYIPMARGFMYLCAIIDVHSRYIVGWSISNSMEADWVVATYKTAAQRYGKPEIINSDQGSQFTSDEWIKACEGVKISMNGKGRSTDNAFIERFFRTIKCDKIYLYTPRNGNELYSLCEQFINYYNNERSHSENGECPPAEAYRMAA
jgi:putative transposase